MAKEKLASNNSFTFIGELGYKEDKLVTVYETPTWEIYTLNFSVKAGNNMHFVEATAFKPVDPTHEITYFVNGESGKPVAEKIAFSSRINVDETKLHSGVNCSLDKGGIKQRFVCSYDFIKAVENYLRSGEHKGKSFTVRGLMEYENYIKEGQTREIEKKVVQHIEEMTEITEPKSEGRYKIYLGSDCLQKFGDVAILEGKSLKTVYNKEKEENEYYGFTTKIEIPLGENADKVFEFLKKSKYYGDDNRFNKIGIICEIINGFEEEEFTEEMLTDEEKMEIDLGFSTFEQIKATKGKGIGEKTRKLKRINEMKGFGKPEETVLSINDLKIYTGVKDSTPVDLSNIGGETNFEAFESDDDEIPF